MLSVETWHVPYQAYIIVFLSLLAILDAIIEWNTH